MAIQYVGGNAIGRAGSVSTVVQSLSGLSGGIASSPSPGDLVVVTIVVGTQGRNPSQALSGQGYVDLTQLNSAADTYDTTLGVSYKIMGSTPDANVIIPATANVLDGQARIVQVFRGVDPSSPMDATANSATGIDTGRFNAPAIDPVTAGAWIVICGGSGCATGTTAYVAPAGFTTNWRSANGADTNDGEAGAGYYRGWASGRYDPAVVTGGSTTATSSWAARTLALRPLAADTITLTPSSNTIFKGNILHLVATATATANAFPIVGDNVIAVSTNVTIANVQVGFRNEAGNIYPLGTNQTSPGYNAPSGTAVKRFTEDANLAWHSMGAANVALNLISGDSIMMVAEVRLSGRQYTTLNMWDDQFNTDNGAIFNLNYPGSIESFMGSNVTAAGIAPLGNSWYQIWIQRKPTITNDVDGVIEMLNSNVYASYTGDGTSYLEVGEVWTAKSAAATNANGKVSIWVLSQTVGSNANITANITAIQSNKSEIAVVSGYAAYEVRITWAEAKYLAGEVVVNERVMFYFIA